MKQAAKETFEDNMRYHDKMKTANILEKLKTDRIAKILPNYQKIAHIFSRNQILIIMWKDQVQQTATENTVF